LRLSHRNGDKRQGAPERPCVLGALSDAHDVVLGNHEGAFQLTSELRICYGDARLYSALLGSAFPLLCYAWPCSALRCLPSLA
jgi:hypothetical protein